MFGNLIYFKSDIEEKVFGKPKCPVQHKKIKKTAEEVSGLVVDARNNHRAEANPQNAHKNIPENGRG